MIMKNWVNQNQDLFLTGANTFPQLENSIYDLRYNGKSLYLRKLYDMFEFPYKIYDVERKFINRVKGAFNSLNKNLGILMHGEKGTGKTISAKLICNELNLPVITVCDNYDITSFLMDFPQDAIILLEEFDKTYESSSALLSILDGISTNNKFLFVLTANEMRVSRYMLDRPSRIRYVKEFGDISVEVLNLIIDDLLINKEHKDNLLKVLSTLRLLTVDTVKAFIEEVNIFDDNPNNLIQDFNCKVNKPEITAEVLIDDSWIDMQIDSDDINILYNAMKNDRTYQDIYDHYAGVLGQILKINSDEIFIKLGPALKQYNHLSDLDVASLRFTVTERKNRVS